MLHTQADTPTLTSGYSHTHTWLPLVTIADLARRIKTNMAVLREILDEASNITSLEFNGYENTEEFVNTVHETIGYYGDKMAFVEAWRYP